MNEKTLETRRVFDGRLIKVDVVGVELESGLRAGREIVRHPGAVGVLGRLPDGRFALVKQFRKAIERELVEIVAGTRDSSETAETCARREMKEETGYGIISLNHMGYLHMAPGFCDERIDLFFAELSEKPGEQNADEDEKLEVILVSRDEMEEMIERGNIHDGKTVAAWYMARKWIEKRSSGNPRGEG